ncbi:MAG TPA: sensor domain-containing diguanylate cyclase [Bauldia sp.]|nr:sensor domain-containing diguanylate cyclase [Bauldia sp.]
MGLSTRIVLAFLGLSLALTAGLGFYSYKTGSKTLVDNEVAKLTSLAIEKDAAIEAFVTERSSHLLEIADDPEWIERVLALVNARPGSSKARVAYDDLVRLLKAHGPGPHNAYVEMSIIDAASGNVLASTDPDQEGKSKIGYPYFERGKQAVYFQPPYLSEDTGQAAITIGVPLLDPSGRPSAVLAVRLRFSELEAIVRRSSGVQRTEDAFLVNSAAIFVTQPRFLETPVALRRVVGTTPARRCAAGLDGWVMATDYRGVPVLAVCRWNATLGLGLILKVDQAELFAPRVAFLKEAAVIAAIALAAATGLIVLLARTITAPLAALKRRVVAFSEDERRPLPLSRSGDEVAEIDAEFTRMVARADLARKLLTDANASLGLLATTDKLTGIANRRRFDEVLLQEWDRAGRDHRPVSLLMADIDHFKRYNDRFGHNAGDECLRHVAATINAGARRPGDIAARYGGEEFAVILPGTDAPGATERAEAIRADVADLAFADGTGSVVTISVGVATLTPRASTKAADLIVAADRGLYRAKAAGRNRACYDPGSAVMAVKSMADPANQDGANWRVHANNAMPSGARPET